MTHMPLTDTMWHLAQVSAALYPRYPERAEGVRLAAYQLALSRGVGTEYDAFLKMRHDALAPIRKPHDWTVCGNDGLCRAWKEGVA